MLGLRSFFLLIGVLYLPLLLISLKLSLPPRETTIWEDANDYALPGDEHEKTANINRGRKRPLQFVHITKTGGTAIEAAAAKAGVTWGMCHYLRNELCVQDNSSSIIRNPSIASPMHFKFEKWHTPHTWFKSPSVYTNADTFVVLRNPYDRMISEYYCKFYGRDAQIRKRGGSRLHRRSGTRNRISHLDGDARVRERRLGRATQDKRWPRNHVTERWPRNIGTRSTKKKKTPEDLNKWIQQELKAGFNTKTAHLFPQHFYVYDDTGKQTVTHILKYETLHDEFSRLMKDYGLPVVLPSSTNGFVNAGISGGMEKKMTFADLTPRTIQMINEVYTDDFQLLDYPMQKG